MSSDAESAAKSREHSVREPFIRCGRALAEWLAHTLLALGIIMCITLVDLAIHRLMGPGDVHFFGILPLPWVFQAADLGVLIGISFYGVKAAIAAYRGRQ